MCVYEFLEVANIAVSVVRAVDIYQDAQETKAQSEIDSKQAISEAKNLEKQAGIERQEGIETARRKKLTSILNMAQEKTIFASNNIMTTSQTALNVINDENLNGELTALNTIQEAEKRSDKYLKSADEYYKKASLSLFKGKQAYQNAFKDISNEVGSLATSLGG